MIINGLTRRQQLIADLLWGASSEEELDEMISLLPNKDRNDAWAIAGLMLMGGDEVRNTREADIIISDIMNK